MQFIFKVTALYYNKPISYRISQISQFEYYAEPAEKNMPPFTLKKSVTWSSKGGHTEWQAAQIGEKIDRLYLQAIKN
ncbi:MAG: hypothetical protein WKF89_05295 [Chitinophagaceae bacterium]